MIPIEFALKFIRVRPQIRRRRFVDRIGAEPFNHDPKDVDLARNLERGRMLDPFDVGASPFWVFEIRQGRPVSPRSGNEVFSP